MNSSNFKQLRVLVESDCDETVKHDTKEQNISFNLKPHQRCGFCKLKVELFVYLQIYNAKLFFLLTGRLNCTYFFF